MKAATPLPKLSPRAAVIQCNFIEATLNQGWCLATQNTLECMLRGTHDHALAVAPDGSYGALHWNSLGKTLRCVQVGTGGIDCFGQFEAIFPPPIQSLADFAHPFRQVLPILQDAHRHWKTAPRRSYIEKFPFSVSGDLRRDVGMAATTQKAKELADLTAVMKAIYNILQSKAPGAETLGAL